VDTSKIVSQITAGQVQSAELNTGSSQTIQVTLKDGAKEQATYLNDLQGNDLANSLNKASAAGQLTGGYNVNVTKTSWIVSALVTLLAGVVLERSGDAIASHIGLSGVLFGATVLAAATSLPEVSTGLTSVRNGDYQLAVSDIFGGNAFLPVLFLPAGLLSGQAVLPQAQDTDIYLTAVGALLTLVYLVGLIFRPQRRIARMGVDSLVVLVLYLLALGGLFAIALT